MRITSVERWRHPAQFVLLGAVAVALIGLILTGGNDESSESRSATGVRPVSVAGVDLYPIPTSVVAACRKAQDEAEVQILCPTRLPRPSETLGHAALPPQPFRIFARSVAPSIEELRRLPREERRRARKGEINGIDISYSAEAGSPRRDRPERFLHLDVQTRERGDRLPPGVGPARIGGRRGLLAPASSRGYAGEPYFANHVRFFWQEGETRYAATLHNFGPGTRAVLGALVEGLRPADQLGREELGLSPGVELIRASVAAPVSVAADDEVVWVAGTRGIVGIDPSSRERIAGKVATRRWPLSLAAGDSVWVAGPAGYDHDERGFPERKGNALQRLHPDGTRFAQSVQAGPELTGVALGQRSVWVADLGGQPGTPDYRRGTAQRIDPEGGRVAARIPVGKAPAGIAVGEGSVWVTNNLDDTVSRIDPRTNRVTATIPVGERPAGIAVGGGAIWVANAASDTLSSIDPETGRVDETIAVGRAPRGVAMGEGSVWATNNLSDTVSRIDPGSRRVIETIRVGAGPAGIAVGLGAVWVASIHDRAVSLIEP